MPLIRVARKGQSQGGHTLNLDQVRKSGTIWATVFNHGGTILNLVNNQVTANPGGNGVSTGGKVATFNGAQQTNLAFTFGANKSANVVIAARIRATAAQAGTPGAAFGVYNSASQYGHGVGFNPSHAVGAATLDGVGAYLSKSIPGVLNQWYTVFVQARFTGASFDLRTWVDGVNIGDVAFGTSNPSVDEFAIGAQHRSTGFLRQFKGDIEWAALLHIDGDPAEFTLTDAKARELYTGGYPYNLVEPINETLWIPDSVAVGGLTITATQGTADASGQIATVNLQTAITASVGTATASGHSANIGLGSTIAATVATADASGYTAAVNLGNTISAGQAVATATGYSAAVDRQLAVLASVGTATANGSAADIQLGSDLSINATSATVTALGFDALINRQLAITASQGAAVASGFDASVASGFVIAASYGLASADGYQAQINLQREIAAGMAAAAAAGLDASVSGAASVYIPGAMTRPSRLQSSGRPSRLQSGTRAAR